MVSLDVREPSSDLPGRDPLASDDRGEMIDYGADRRDSPDVTMEHKPKLTRRSGGRRRHLFQLLVVVGQRLRQDCQAKTSADGTEESGQIVGPKCKFTLAGNCSQPLVLRQMILALIVPQEVQVLGGRSLRYCFEP